MDPKEVETLITNALEGAHTVVLDPNNDRTHLEAQVVWDGFEGMRLVQRHRAVYQAVQNELDSGRLHALQLTCLTTQEAKERASAG